MPSPKAARPAFMSCSETTYLYAASEIELALCQWRLIHEQRHRITSEPRNETIKQACIICFDHWIWVAGTIHQSGLHAPGLTFRNAMIPNLIPRIGNTLAVTRPPRKQQYLT